MPFIFLLEFINIKYKDTAIKKNNKVQIGAKIQLGGLKNGLLSDWYQLLMDGVVTLDPRKAVKKHTNNDSINQAVLFLFILYFKYFD